MKRFKITEGEYIAIKKAERETREKKVSRRLRVLMMRYEGSTTEEAAKATGMSRVNVSLICKRYKEQGLEELIRNKYTSHRRALTEEKENEILERFEKAAEAGQEVTAKEIKAAFDEARGKDTGSGYIYMLLNRGFNVTESSVYSFLRNEEACEASKKLSSAYWIPEKTCSLNFQGKYV